MHTVYVVLGREDYPECPLCNDLNMCEGVEKSEVNSCPILSEDGETWDAPEWCPLRDGGVHIKPQDDTEPEPVPDWAAAEIKATWRTAKDAGGQEEAYRIIERMVDRLGYGRTVDNPSLAIDKETEESS